MTSQSLFVGYEMQNNAFKDIAFSVYQTELFNFKEATT